MQRYFIDQTLQIHHPFEIDSDDLHHIKHVMRLQNQDQIICIDKNKKTYLAKIENINQGTIEPIELIDVNNELDIEVTLIYAMPKGDKFEMVLQKATELGVTRIIPMQTKRCVAKLTLEKFNKKVTRYKKILKEASEQSLRSRIPEIMPVIQLNDIESYLGDYNLVAYEETAKANKHGQLALTLQQICPGDHLVIIVGSEGGFDAQEVEFLNGLGVKNCSLGKRILRSETAPLYLLSVIGYSREILK